MDLKNLKTAFNWLLDFFIPRTNLDSSSIHNYLTLQEIAAQKSKLLPVPPELTEVLESVFLCSNYKSALIHDLIFRTKFNGELAIIDSLVDLLEQKTQELPKPDIITFVPADPIRNLERGYHLPYKLASKLSYKKTIQLLELVSKTRSTKPQTKLDKKDRLENLKNVFVFDTDNLQTYKADFEGVIWLIDDIITTMTTTSTVAKIIKQQYPKSRIIAIAIAG